MKKLFRSKKALSPVVAAIILIAVTVAVSIAVAAWMGALTFTFMATETVTFTDCTFSPDGASVALTINNTGTSSVTISKVYVNNQDATGTSTVGSGLTLAANSGGTITINPSTAYSAGANYAFTVQSSKGNRFGPYTATAPS